jgi:K+-transporting ATPase c subunit
MKTPEKAKARILDIAEREGLSDIVTGYGVDRVWELIKEETEDEIFTPMSEICVNVLNELK